MKPHTNNAGSSPSIIPAEIYDGSMGSNCSDDETVMLFEPIGTGEEESYPAQDRPSPEEMAFLVSLGWKEDEIVPPLKQEEIADCVSVSYVLLISAIIFYSLPIHNLHV